MSENTQTPNSDEQTQETPTQDSPAQDVQADETVTQLDPAQARIEELEAELAAAKDQILRTLAESQNIQRRAKKEVEESRIYAVEKFARDLLSVSDNMTRALEALTDEARAELTEAGLKLLEGVDLTQKELHTVLGRHGVKPIIAEPGSDFDPNFHQAVTQIPSEHPSGKVAECFQAGWSIGSRTLRAAMVAVSA